MARLSDVFAYDRAGYGGSDPGPRPRDGARLVNELRQVLESTGRRPPYVLVGHSLGGTLMELYARSLPSEVSGLVLVDSRSAELSARCVEAGLTCGDVELDGLPEPIRSELAASPETERQVRAAGPPGAMPAIVLAHGRPDGTPEYEALWRSSQEELAATLGAQLIIAEMSGHHVQLDEPHLVIEAVRSVIQSSRCAKRRWRCVGWAHHHRTTFRRGQSLGFLVARGTTHRGDPGTRARLAMDTGAGTSGRHGLWVGIGESFWAKDRPYRP